VLSARIPPGALRQQGVVRELAVVDVAEAAAGHRPEMSNGLPLCRRVRCPAQRGLRTPSAAEAG
jgi:hypothetical protein